MYYSLVYRRNFSFLPLDVNVENIIVFNDINAVNRELEKLKTLDMIEPVRLEESVFKNGKLCRKRIINNFEKHDDEEEEGDT